MGLLHAIVRNRVFKVN